MYVTNIDSKGICEVTLDGAVVKNCYEADDELGYVVCVEDEKVFNDFKVKNEDLPYIKKYGKVELHKTYSGV